MRVVIPELTGKKRIFADNYLANGLNATQAYVEAGYKTKTEAGAASSASRLLRNDKVQEYIEYQLKEIESAKIAKTEEVLQMLTKILRREETEQQAVIVKNPTTIRLSSADGNYYDKFAYEETAETIETKTKNSDVVRAAELLGKYHKMWTDKVDVTGDVGVTIVDDV